MTDNQSTTTTAFIDRWDPVGELLSSEAVLAVLRDELSVGFPDGLNDAFRAFPLGVFLTISLGDEARVEQVLARLAAVPSPVPRRSEPATTPPRADYEDASVPLASASLTAPNAGVVHRPVEIVIDGPSHGNPFVDVDLGGTFRLDGTNGTAELAVGGFYDGDGTYRIRFLPPAAGEWTLTTTSNARSLDSLTASIRVEPAQPGTREARGPVAVVPGTFGFAHRDGTPFVPLGTTAYAWTHQPEALQERTLAALAAAPFNKLRMCLFPKSFLYNSNEPDRFVFPRTAGDESGEGEARVDAGGFDLERFDLEYFRHLERRIRDLAERGIQADLILFHPYDRWGFSALGAAVDDRYVRYVVRRLAAFDNVWWSLANEYELLTAKRPADWERIGRLIEREDHVGHPRSIHNIVQPWDASQDWVTHCSIQRSDPSIGDQVDRWRRRWGKPVLVDEMGYEGDLDQGWGSLTAQEMVLRCWQVMARGGYPTHGETFWAEDEVIFWAKGGDLVGESIPRLAFLRDIVAESPTGRLDPLPSEFDAVWAGVENSYILVLLGRGRPRFRDVPVPPGFSARIDVIDSWAMTTTPVPGAHTGTVRVNLPSRPGAIIRLRLSEA